MLTSLVESVSIRVFSPRLKKVHLQLITRIYELNMNRQNEKM